MGPNLFVRNGNSVYVIPCVTTHAVTSCMHCMAHAHRQSSHPYVNMVQQKFLSDMPFMPAELYLRKLTASHFSILNMKIANQNMQKGFSLPCTMRTRLIAMRTRLSKACRDRDITITSLVLVHFGLIK